MKRDKKKNKNKKIAVIILSVIILFIAIIYTDNENKPTSSGVIWNGNQSISVRSQTDYIAIPAFGDLYLSENSLKQDVNFFNPEENKCSMDLSIYLENGELLWSNKSLMPGYGYYDITLEKPLKKGTYKAYYSVRCFTLDSQTEVNGGKFEITIYVK